MILSLRPGYPGNIRLIYRGGPALRNPSGSITSVPDAGPVLLEAVLRR